MLRGVKLRDALKLQVNRVFFISEQRINGHVELSTEKKGNEYLWVSVKESI